MVEDQRDYEDCVDQHYLALRTILHCRSALGWTFSVLSTNMGAKQVGMGTSTFARRSTP